MQPFGPSISASTHGALDRSIKAGDIIDDRYRVIQLLADGGMGTVFLAEHVLIKRRVAIKVLHAELAADTEMLKRFMNEALAAGTLGHPNIVESTDMGFTAQRVPFIVFEYLEGSLLVEEIYRTGGLGVERAVRLALQIASALEAAHNASIVHLDLKSDNVFLTDKDGASDHVKVLDFGISRFMELESSTQRNLLIGTPEFMAPEQIMAPDTVDKRADIYALGVVLYEMLAARRPYVGTDPRVLLHQVCNEAPPPLGCARVPAELEALLFDRLLAKDREQRLQSMQEVQQALEPFARRQRASDSWSPVPMPVTAEGSAALPAGAQPVALGPVPRSRTWGWLALALVSGAVAGGLVVADARTTASTDEVALRALHVDAEKLAATLHADVRAARLRAEGIASTPMVRVAVETDEATVRDMARNESLFTGGVDEVIELRQQQGPVMTTLVRVPEAAKAMPAHGEGAAARYARVGRSADGTLVVSAREPVMLQRGGGVGGELVLSRAVDLGLMQRLVAQDAVSARLEGIGSAIELVPARGGASAEPLRIPVPLDAGIADGPVVLVASVRETASGRNLHGASVAAAGTSGMCLLVFVGTALLRRRRPR